MGVMKDFDIRLRNGGDDAIAAATELNLLTWQENQRLRPTDEERAALHWFAHYGLPEHRAAAVRGLLERLNDGT